MPTSSGVASYWQALHVSSPLLPELVPVIAALDVPYAAQENRLQSLHLYLPHTPENARLVGTPVQSLPGKATATNAPNVQFNLAIGVSSTRRRGEPKSTEIILELSGEDHAGQPLRTRQAVVHRGGAAPLTGLGVAMLLERLTGLDGQPPTPAGLYFPYQLLEPTAYFARLAQSGGLVLPLEVL
jgi:hypothetical protein